MTINKKNVVLYAIIGYLTIISLSTSGFLIYSIGEIIAKRNEMLMISLVLNLAMTAFNIMFFRMKRQKKDYRLILLFNSIYAIIYGFAIKVAGVLVINYLGFNISLLYIQNNGSSFELNYGGTNLNLELLSYDKSSEPGFSFAINLIMLVISIALIYFYNSIRKSEKLTNQPG